MQISLKIDTRSIGLRQKIMKIEYIQFFFFFSFKLAYTNEEIKFKEQTKLSTFFFGLIVIIFVLWLSFGAPIIS